MEEAEAAEIVREITALGAADLAAAAEPLRADCLRLTQKVSLLSHLVAEVAEVGPGMGGAEAVAWVDELVRALQVARRFATLGRTPLPPDQSRGCFGCCDKAVKHVGELSKSLMVHTQNPTVGEEFWSTTTIEVDPADLRGVIHTSSWDLDQFGVGSSHNPPEFVNPGLPLWKQTRQEWTSNGRQQPIMKQIREPLLSWNAAYESLLGSNKPFVQPIPLHEMVDFLVDIWEQEGLFD